MQTNEQQAEQNKLMQDYRLFTESIERGLSICEIFACPHGRYQAGQGKSYGCQKYSTARQCILTEVRNTRDNQYFVYVEDSNKLCLNQAIAMKLAVDNVPSSDTDLLRLQLEVEDLNAEYNRAGDVGDEAAMRAAKLSRDRIKASIDKINNQP